MAAEKERYLALLRGINLLGRNRILMEDLRRIFRQIGCDDVGTYIQSGNVLFRASPQLAGRVPNLAVEEISAKFGFSPPIQLRTPQEMIRIAKGNPFEEPEPKLLHVVFLANLPKEHQVAALDPERSPPDSIAVRGREIYLHTPDGMAGTKFDTGYFDTVLETTSTMRNWRTTVKLTEMLV